MHRLLGTIQVGQFRPIEGMRDLGCLARKVAKEGLTSDYKIVIRLARGKTLDATNCNAPQP